MSPCPPSTNELTFSTDTPSSIAINVLMRAESSTPAIPMMRCCGNLVSRKSACAIASSGFATGMTIAFRRVLHQVRRDALHDLEVVAHQIVAAHRRLARLARRDHDDVRAGRGAPVGAADDADVRPDDRAGLVDVEGHAGRLGSAMSMITTSASSFSAMARATVAPTLPAPPTTVTLRFMQLLFRVSQRPGEHPLHSARVLGQSPARTPGLLTVSVENPVENMLRGCAIASRSRAF